MYYTSFKDSTLSFQEFIKYSNLVSTVVASKRGNSSIVVRWKPQYCAQTSTVAGQKRSPCDSTSNRPVKKRRTDLYDIPFDKQELFPDCSAECTTTAQVIRIWNKQKTTCSVLTLKLTQSWHQSWWSCDWISIERTVDNQLLIIIVPSCPPARVYNLMMMMVALLKIWIT